MSQFGGILVEPTTQPQSSGGSRFGGIPVDVQTAQKPTMQRESAAQLAQPLKDYEAKKAQYGIPSPLDFLSGVADKLGLGATGQYVDLGLRAAADLPIGAAQTVTDLVAPDSLMAEALNKVATDTDRLQAQTPYGGLVRGGVQVAQTLPVGGGILSSTASGGLQPVSGENANARNMQRLQNAGTGAAFGAVAKGAAPVIEGAINKGSRLVSKGLDYVADNAPMVKGAADAMRAATPQLPKTGEELKKLTTQAYNKAAQTGGQLPANVTDNFINDLESLRPKLIAGKVLPSEGKVLNDIIDEYAPLKGSALNFDDVKALDQSFGDKITAALATGNKTVARSLQEVQAKFRGVIDDAAQGLPQLAEARKMAAAQFKMADIENIMKRAEMSDNPATALRTGFKNLYNNAKKSRGYTKQELALIKEAASTSLPAEGLRMVGSRLGAIISLGSGGGAAQTAATAVGGAVARKALEGNQMAKGNKVLEAISNRVVPQQATTIGNISKGVAEATKLAPRAALPSVTAQPSMVQTPPVTLPNATQPSTMDVVPFEQMMPESQPNTGTVQPLTPERFNPSPQSSIEGVIGEAAQIGGASPDLLQAIAETESSLNPQAKASTSSASGLFQITKDTWRNLVAKYGKETGIAMKDIMNPRANAIMAAYLTKENADKVSKALGRDITAGESYIAHFMGAAGATKLLQADDNKLAWKLFPQAAKANKSIFFAGKTPRTVGELKSILANKVESKIAAKEQQKQQEQQQPLPQEQMPQEPDIQLAKIPFGAIQELKRNPQSAQQFDEIFGAGAAKKLLNT